MDSETVEFSVPMSSRTSFIEALSLHKRKEEVCVLSLYLVLDCLGGCLTHDLVRPVACRLVLIAFAGSETLRLINLPRPVVVPRRVAFLYAHVSMVWINESQPAWT